MATAIDTAQEAAETVSAAVDAAIRELTVSVRYLQLRKIEMQRGSLAVGPSMARELAITAAEEAVRHALSLIPAGTEWAPTRTMLAQAKGPLVRTYFSVTQRPTAEIVVEPEPGPGSTSPRPTPSPGAPTEGATSQQP